MMKMMVMIMMMMKMKMMVMIMIKMMMMIGTLFGRVCPADRATTPATGYGDFYF
jgi:hypothetical protein